MFFCVSGVAHLDNVQLKTAERNGAGPRADWVERCDLDGYRGESLKECAPGYTRDPPNGGVYAQCVPCNCNGHSTTCDANTGEFCFKSFQICVKYVFDVFSNIFVLINGWPNG